jgi:hypothetical protein
MSENKQKQSEVTAKNWENANYFNCHKPGHRLKDCPEKPRRDFLNPK